MSDQKIIIRDGHVFKQNVVSEIEAGKMILKKRNFGTAAQHELFAKLTPPAKFSVDRFVIILAIAIKRFTNSGAINKISLLKNKKF